jgi:SnoaL-like domain
VDDDAAINQLLARYTHASDDLRTDDFVDLFAPDGSLTLVSVAVHPREKIREFCTKASPGPPGPRRAFMHLTLSSLIDITSESSAKAVSDAVVLAVGMGDGVSIIGVGRYHDVLVKLDGRWFFKERVAKMEYPETGGEPLDEVARAVMSQAG